MQLTIVLLVLLLPLFFTLLTILTGMWEKRTLWTFVPEAEAPPGLIAPPAEYLIRANNVAISLGLGYLGTFGHGGGTLYRVRYHLYILPRFEAIIVVGEGSIARLPIAATTLYTRLSDGTLVATTDNMAAVETDLTKTTLEEIWTGADFETLVRRHLERLAVIAPQVAPFSYTDPLADFKEWRAQRIEALIRQGYASFLDDRRLQWRYTPLGATLFAIRGHSRKPRPVSAMKPIRTGIELPDPRA
ncbi:MAG: hypothetical protein SFU56_14800 [Capsulimonadales bacterium]|nr:hypothetical protein [Capsulimonadales bacterium]